MNLDILMMEHKMKIVQNAIINVLYVQISRIALNAGEKIEPDRCQIARNFINNSLFFLN